MPEAPRSCAAPPVLAYVLGDALYLNVTSTCTLACIFCPKIRDGNFVLSGYDLELARPPSADAVWDAARRAGVDGRTEVVFTGFGEPTHRLDVLLDLVHRLKQAGVERVRLDTDGLATLRSGRDVAAELGAAGLDAVCVSLNAPDPETYRRLCPNRYGARAWEASAEFIRRAVTTIPEVAASCVGVPGISEDACRRVVEALGAKFRWRPYDRVGRLREAGGDA